MSRSLESQESVIYERSAFGHGWDDANGDCQDNRAEALIAASTTTVRFADDRRCRVFTGRWISPFTGKVIQNASDIDIDHVVPLAWAWERGAREWSREKRVQFANDPVNLLPVEASFTESEQGSERTRRMVASSRAVRLRSPIRSHCEAVCSRPDPTGKTVV